MRRPEIYTASMLRHWPADVQIYIHPNQWVPARPESRGGVGLRHRIKMAWLVFTGRCDVLEWDGQ